MSARLYFLVPTVETAKSIIHELQAVGVDEQQTSVIAADSTPLDELNEASILETSELRRGLEGGIGVGGVAGLLGGLWAVTYPPAGLVLGGAAVLATTVAGAGLAGLVSALVAKDIPHPQVKAFEAALARGELLLFVDVTEEQKEQALKTIKKHHPQATIDAVVPSTDIKGLVSVIQTGSNGGD